jgi:hypothetical protein
MLNELFSSFAHLLAELFVILVLNFFDVFMYSVDEYLAKIFFHSVGCLFTLLSFSSVVL